MAESQTRYHLFGTDQYDSAGGMGDYCGSFDSPDAAAVYIRGARHMDSWHMAVVDERGNLTETEHWWSDYTKGWLVIERPSGSSGG